MKQYLNQFFFLLKDDKSQIAFIVFLFLLSSLLDLIGIGLIAPYISLVISDDTKNVPNFILNTGYESKSILSLMLVLIFFLKAISIVFIHKKIVYFSQYKQVDICSYLMKTYQSLPYTRFIEKNSANYVYNIQTLTVKFSQIILSSLKFFGDAVVTFFILMLLAWHNISVLLVLLVTLGGSVYLYDILFKEKMTKYGSLANKFSTQMVKGVYEGLEGYKEVKILGRESFFYNSVVQGAIGHAENHTKFQVISIIPRFLLEFLLVFMIVLFFTFHTLSESSVQLMVSTIGVFGVAALRLLPSINGISNNLMQLRFEKDSLDRLYLDVKKISKFQLENSNVINKNKVLITSIELKNISYHYPDIERNVLNDITLKIKCGQSIGIIGKSGSGKTTIIDVLLGLLQPTKGSVLINGKASHSSLLQSQVAYLPQQAFLIDNSLRANIALGEDNIDEEKIKNSIKKAKLTELIESLPFGLDQVVGERGVKLSGGQRQRISLARAFYFDRSILVMDESTSALDIETEKEIVKEIEGLKGSKTLIIIAHRLSTLQSCDFIFKIENGVLSEYEL
jgi:ATP-binding cassette, subfamily B, bacterial PglK